MKRYKLLTENDLIRGQYYEVISYRGKNPNPISEIVFFDQYGDWCLADNHRMIAVIDNSIMHVLAKKNPERFREILLGGSYEDGEYNNERCASSYIDCEEYYKSILEKENTEEEYMIEK